MDIPDTQAEEILELVRQGYFAIIFNEEGEPEALIDPAGNVTNKKDFDILSDERKRSKIVNINGIVNINILCKPNGSACCVSWDDRVKCWC